MSKIKRVIAGLGLVTGFGVAMLPMTAFADDPTPAVGESVITANINEVIGMRLVSSGSAGNKTLECNSGENPNCTGQTQLVSTTILPGQDDKTSMYTDVYVSTNSINGYNLTLIDADAYNALRTTGGDAINAIATEPVGTTNPGWAVSITGKSGWFMVPVSTGSAIDVKTLQPSPAAVTIEDHTKVTYGVAATSSQPSGIYTDTVVYTATAR